MDLYVIVCAAGPVRDLPELIAEARSRSWTVQIVATPKAVDFIDEADLERRTGRKVRVNYRHPSEPKPPRADAILVYPATFNTVNKFALGITDTYALGLLAEAPGLGIPVTLVPFVNDALAGRAPYRAAVAALEEEGVAFAASWREALA
ncbi:flavoprotein [Herbidospora sp. NBRC 101105]|uniref:flavoprotein n=1 Tax=Herbidospora sp. NBRC 101105 TaxID=3032195 RepID=UPI0024A5573A|nr:flavoprotein [Herbidospora sp. NBRC 101105]GLX98002.1 flavoprotein [Herbidospora sp. NBRC 101105]